MIEKKLLKSAVNRMICGVCGGIAEYSEIDLTLVRVLMALFIIFGVGLMVYIVMWIIIPLEPAKQENHNEYRR